MWNKYVCVCLIMEKYKFDEPEKVDKKLAELIVDEFPKKVHDNLKKKDIKI